ncbi:hypothetical protein Trydic_g2806 [Trypoxylus dichotomus]
MGLLGKLFFAVIAVLIVLLGIKINNLLFQEPPLPVLKNVWWGPGRETKVDTSIRPFKIDVPQKVVDDLQQRLKNSRQFTPPLEGIQQQYGMNTELLSEIIEFWKTRYDWRQRETWLNQYPQFKTNIQGLDIHFLHVKPSKTDGLKVLPLLLLHGWPGSVREFYEAIPFLTTPRKGQDFVFELIIPSLPGYGFSQAASKKGLGPPQIAVIFKNLMERLGFKRILGMHSNMCFVDSPLATLKLVLGSIYPPAVVDKKFEEKLYPLSSFLEFILLEFGYMHLQATKPDTVGVGLNDSPVGLAAYILEKFTTWTNTRFQTQPDGGLKEKFFYAHLLDNVMIYWVTNSVTTSMRLYAEAFNKDFVGLGFASLSVNVPSACARFANELSYQPDNFLTLKYKNLVHSSDIENGAIIFVALGLKIKKFFEIPSPPYLQDEWWGAGQETEVDTSIRPFKVEIEQKVLDDLHQRLNNARPFTPPIEGVQQQYGMNSKLLSEIIEFWKSKYDWRQRETFLNQYPQYMTNIQGLDIHFLHVKPSKANGLKVLPLLLVHGWPGSVREFYELIPLLTQPRAGKDFVFEVIVPSLPGFGFSSAASKPGLNSVKMALIFRNLMNRIGFKQFYVQGGDWGGFITSVLATVFPEEILGVHMNFAFVRNQPIAKIKMMLKTFLPVIFATAGDQKKMAQNMIYPTRENGYYQIQSTKPDTVGVGLNDSPVGLAAYIIEKFTTWTNTNWIDKADGGLLEKYDYTKLLDNVMLYWVTNSITTSCRIYYEQNTKEVAQFAIDKIPVSVPTGVTNFEHELFSQSEDILRCKYLNLLHYREVPNVGHFAAFEEPEVMAKELWEAFGKCFNFHKDR